MKDAGASYIREVAVQPGTANNIAMGGFDQKLNILDLNRPDAPYIQRMDMQGVIGSVKWAPFHGRQWESARTACLSWPRWCMVEPDQLLPPIYCRVRSSRLVRVVWSGRGQVLPV